jgi:cytoskeletal protein CcmA (bactofilin family)
MTPTTEGERTMFNKRTGYDRGDSNDPLSALDRELGASTGHTAQSAHSTTPTPSAPRASTGTETETSGRASGGETVLAEGATFNGKATITGTLRVEGKAQGEVRATDTVVVGRSGHLEANVTTSRAVFNGKYTGRVEAKDRVELQSGSHVEGDIVASNMVMEDGVYFRGNCQIGSR